MKLMTKADRYRAKMLRGFVRALENEEAHVRRYSRIGKAWGALGGLVLFFALFAALRGNDYTGMWLVVSGVVAGFLMGLGVFFKSAIEQWPVNREFLNVDAIREAARRNEL